MIIHTNITFKLRVASIIFIAAMVLSCSNQVEDNLLIYDEHYRSLVVQKLQTDGIPFREGSNGSIWYSVEYREEVASIEKNSAEIHARTFYIYDENLLASITQELTAKHIDYVEQVVGAGHAITVSSDKIGEARALYEGIILPEPRL